MTSTPKVQDDVIFDLYQKGMVSSEEVFKRLDLDTEPVYKSQGGTWDDIITINSKPTGPTRITTVKPQTHKISNTPSPKEYSQTRTREHLSPNIDHLNNYID